MTSWYGIAEGELGQAERPGPAENPRIAEYFSGAGHPEVNTEVTPWCAAFVGWCLAQDGIDGTGSLMAKSYLRYGEATQVPRKGCIVVMNRGSDPASGHVGFFHSRVGDRIMLLGGNQGDKVSIQGFPVSSVCKNGYRWPPAATVPKPTAEEHYEVNDELTLESLWYRAKGWLVKWVSGSAILGAGGISQLLSNPVDIALLLIGAALIAVVALEVMRYRQRSKAMGA